MGKNYNSSRLVNGLSVDASGNVAIGIATPTTRLTIGRVDSSSEGGQIDLCRASDNFNAWGIDVFGNTTTPSLRFIDNVASAARMVITGAGNVGIGTSSPMPWGGGFLGLSVGQASVGCLPTTANSYFTNNIYYDGAFRRGVAAASSIISMNEDVITFGNSAAGTAGGTITFNERMRITSGGQVAINNTGGGLDTARFYVLGTAGTAGEFGVSGVSGTLIRFSNGQSVGGSITIAAGGGTAYNTSSDYRLKEDFKEINGLEKVLAIKTYNFKWKICDDRMDGVIAHELQKVLPYAVSGEKDGEQMQGVDYSLIVPALVKAIQELSAKVSALENKS
jgi:hypothetical protein